MSQTITVPTIGQSSGFTAVQNYTYDSLSRLKSAQETIAGVTSWKQAYTFDRYGNRRFDFANGNTTFPDPNCPEAICNPSVSTANNRLTSTGWQYGTAGNTTNDPQGRQFTYDAENKQVKVLDSQQATIGEYSYDGDGRRVKKIVPGTGEVTVFVCDAGAKLIGEYSTIAASVEDAKVAYLTNDHLGSPRINTDANGAVTARHDYHPFGEEIGTLASLPGSPQPRTAALGYLLDDVRQKFTSKQRDTESNLDYFEARYYSSLHGRFVSPDIFWKDSNTRDPQSWNKYIYVRNLPLSMIDPTGEKAEITIDVDEKNKTATITIRARFGIYAKKGKYSRSEMDAHKKMLKDQIDKVYQSGAGAGVTVNGVTATIKTDITVTEFASEEDAIAAGKKGEIDNIVGLRKESTFLAQGKQAIGVGYALSTENFDRLEIATVGRTTSDNVYAHEFGHLLGAGSHTAVGVMKERLPVDNYLSADDFGVTLKPAFDRHSRGQIAVIGQRNFGVRNGSENIYGYQSRTTQTVRAPKFWWTPVGR